ncbi:MAG: methyltransferase domain-containing protein [Patescibacteria group bacterium]
MQESHYHNLKYDSKRRFASYWHQIAEVITRNPKEVLEVGVGSGFVSRYLRAIDMQVTTVDLDSALGPDYVADARSMPFQDKEFDLAVAYEVLEHMPYSDALLALRELYRVSRQGVIVSFPDATRSLPIQLPIPGLGIWRRVYTVPRLVAKTHILTKSGHHWEIGKSKFSLRRITSDLENIGFRIIKTYRVFENPYHRFFILEKKS